MVKDNAEGITSISWTVYGKIRQIVKGDSVAISYTYDASGNRISKSVIKSGSTDTARTWYVRDAQGNVMSVYEAGRPSVNEGHLTQSELHLYGSSRIGLLRRSFDVAEEYNPADTTMPLLGTGLSHNFGRGNKLFELSNHLGNVLVTVNDKKLGVSSNNNTVDYFNPQVVSAQDYYPFGMLQVGRISNSSGYRFGFNGKENDNEVKGEGNQQDYGMRVYDPRLGRFLSLDPIANQYPELTPYQFSSNRPIDGIDLDGLEYLRSDNAKISVNNGVVMLNVDNLGEIARNSYRNANKAAGGVSAWTDKKTGQTYMANAVSTEVASFTFQGSDGKPLPLDMPKFPFGNISIPDANPAEFADNLSDPLAEVPRTYSGVDKNGNPKEMAYTTPSPRIRGMARGILIVNVAIITFQKYISWVIKNEMDAVTDQFNNQFKRAYNDVVKAANEGLIPPQYLNTRDLSSIVNVVLSGVNNSEKKEIYNIGISIYKKYNPPPLKDDKETKRLDFMQNQSGYNPVIDKTKETKE